MARLQEYTSIEEHEIQQDQSIPASRVMLEKMQSVWGRRAQVKKEIGSIKDLLEPHKPDYLESLLPFHDHPNYQAASEEMKQRILSCGWIAYNEKTIAIETKIITPTCFDILYGKVPGATDQVSRQIISETLVDEAYHVLLVVNACKLTREQRQLNLQTFPMYRLEKSMKAAQASYSEDWKKVLVQLACSIVSEIFISDYLDLLSDAKEVQALNRETVAVHRKDELAHSNIFKHLTRCIYPALSADQKRFLSQMFPKAVKWFADAELDIWHWMLDQIAFKPADRMINDCREINSKRVQQIDYSGIINLSEELGILSDPVVRQAFEDEGLIH